MKIKNETGAAASAAALGFTPAFAIVAREAAAEAAAPVSFCIFIFHFLFFIFDFNFDFDFLIFSCHRWYYSCATNQGHPAGLESCKSRVAPPELVRLVGIQSTEVSSNAPFVSCWTHHHRTVP